MQICLVARSCREKLCHYFCTLGSPDDIGKISEVTITPDPPEKGKDLSVNADVTLSKTISYIAGSLKLHLKFPAGLRQKIAYLLIYWLFLQARKLIMDRFN